MKGFSENLQSNILYYVKCVCVCVMYIQYESSLAYSKSFKTFMENLPPVYKEICTVTSYRNLELNLSLALKKIQSTESIRISKAVYKEKD